MEFQNLEAPNKKERNSSAQKKKKTLVDRFINIYYFP